MARNRRQARAGKRGAGPIAWARILVIRRHDSIGWMMSFSAAISAQIKHEDEAEGKLKIATCDIEMMLADHLGSSMVRSGARSVPECARNEWAARWCVGWRLNGPIPGLSETSAGRVDTRQHRQ